MNIKRFPIPPKKRQSIESFADEHGLTMEVHEREASDLPRYYAKFSHVETKSGNTLTGVTGNGESEDAAIAEYARLISGKRIVVHAMDSNARREIDAPELFYQKHEDARLAEESIRAIEDFQRKRR